MRGSALQSARRLLQQGDSAGLTQLAERVLSGSLASSAGSVASPAGGLSKADLRCFRTLAQDYRLVLERAWGSEASALQQVCSAHLDVQLQGPPCQALNQLRAYTGTHRAQSPGQQSAQEALQLGAA